MFDPDNCVRCTKAATSFHGKTVLNMMESLDEDRDAKTAAKTKPEWDEALANFDKLEAGEAVDFKTQSELHQHTRCGHRMSMRYAFMTCRQFLSLTGVEVKSIPALKIIQRWCHLGMRMLDGIAFTPEPGDEYGYRIYEHFWESYTLKEDSIMLSGDRLREAQPLDLFNGINKDDGKKDPSAFVGGNRRA
jgi:hypothetical protein